MQKLYEKIGSLWVEHVSIGIIGCRFRDMGNDASLDKDSMI